MICFIYRVIAPLKPTRDGPFGRRRRVFDDTEVSALFEFVECGVSGGHGSSTCSTSTVKQFDADTLSGTAMDGGLPGHNREAQPTILVSGEARSLVRRIPLQLLGERAVSGDGLIVVSTRDDPTFIARRLIAGVEALDPNRVALIDCTTKEWPAGGQVAELRWEVQSAVGFDEISDSIASAFDVLTQRDTDRIHFLFDTLTTQFRLSNPDVVLQRTNDLAMAIGSYRGLGLFVVGRRTVTDREFDRLRHLVDAHVAVRRGANGPEVQWTGLLGSSDGWVPLADTGIHFDELGRRLE